MTSLRAHLRESDDHGRLPFHPECPRCRERLIGVLPDDAIVSRRMQALVAAGVLALSSGTPTTVLAAEPDEEQEGVAAPEGVAGDLVVSADFDPGGGSTELSFEPAPAPQANAAPDAVEDVDAGPVEPEPATDVEVPVVDLGDGSGTPVTAAPPPAPPAAPAPAPASVPAAEAPTPAEPVRESRAKRRERERPRRAAPAPRAEPVSAAAPVTYTTTTAEPDTTTTVEPDTTTTVEPDTTTTVEPDTTTIVEPAQTQPAPSPQPVAPRGRPARRGDRFHVVRPGESLWSIARDLQGRDASVAAVSREVNRLWELNKRRIGTGDPDLLIAGTRLTLR
jgi:LysM domain